MTGNVYPEIERRVRDYPHRGPRIVFRNLDGRRFEDVTELTGRPRSRGAARGAGPSEGGTATVLLFVRIDCPISNR